MCCGGGELQGADQELVQEVDGEPPFQPVSAAEVGPFAVGSSAFTFALHPGQDTSQFKEQRLLQRHSLRRRGRVELCLEYVQERHSGVGGLAAEGSPGLHQTALAAQQVRVVPGPGFTRSNVSVYGCMYSWLTLLAGASSNV